MFKSMYLYKRFWFQSILETFFNLYILLNPDISYLKVQSDDIYTNARVSAVHLVSFGIE